MFKRKTETCRKAFPAASICGGFSRRSEADLTGNSPQKWGGYKREREKGVKPKKESICYISIPPLLYNNNIRKPAYRPAENPPQVFAASFAASCEKPHQISKKTCRKLGHHVCKPVSQLEEIFSWQVSSRTLPKPEREHKFSSQRRWRFDFAWPSLKLAVEVEGGTWKAGTGHNTGKAYAEDCEKYAVAVINGWSVIRATSDQVKSGQAITWVELWMKAQGVL